VDAIVATVDKAMAKQGITTKAVERWKEEMPTEQEMVPKDKYTIFDRKEKKYRKGIHSRDHHGRLKLFGIRLLIMNIELPKWTRVSQRVNPPGY
jgi:hypothetical protein